MMRTNATDRCNRRVARGAIAASLCSLSLCAQLAFGAELHLDSSPQVTESRPLPTQVASSGPPTYFADKLVSFETSDPTNPDAASAERFEALEARLRELEGGKTSDAAGSAAA